MPLSLDGTGSIIGISTVSVSDDLTHVGDVNTKISFPANDTISFETGGVEKLRITSAGQLGVGVAAPTFAAINSISANAARGIEIYKDGADTGSAIKLAGDNGSGNKAYSQLGYSGANATAHWANYNTSGTLQGEIVIGSTGKIGIGTDIPTYKLHVDSGDAAIGLWKSRRSSGSYIDYSVGANGAALGFIGAGGQILTGGADSGDFAIRSQGDLCFASGGSTERVRITSDGKLGINEQSPQSLLDIHDSTAANDTPEIRIESFRPTIRFADRSSSQVDSEICGDNGIRFRVSAESDNDTALIQRVLIDSGGKLWVDRTHASATTGNHPALDLDTYANGTAGSTFATGIDFRVAGVHKKRMVVTNGSGTGGGDWIFYRDNGNNVGLQISSTGAVTKPNQPSCMAYNAQGQMIAGGATAAFNSTRFNIGSHYNSSNGRFTAPIAGRYLVAYSGLHDAQGQSNTGFAVQLNGSNFDGGEGYDDVQDGTSQCQLAKTLILNMNVNDYVSIYVRASGTRIHQRYGSFSVCLLT